MMVIIFLHSSLSHLNGKKSEEEKIETREKEEEREEKVKKEEKERERDILKLNSQLATNIEDMNK